MASPGGGVGDGSGSPATEPHEVIDDLLEARKQAVMLHNMLQGTSSSSCVAASTRQLNQLIDGVMSRLQSSSLSPGGGGRRGSGGRKKKSATAVAGPHRRSSSGRRRSKSPFVKTVTTKELEDGKQWRKYGQKHIQDSPNNPRSYYRCTHRPDQGCMATKQVQASESNPSEFVINYYGEHTCRDPSTIPFVVEAEAPIADYANLISFGSSAVASTSRDPLRQSHHRLMAEAVDTTPSCSFANCHSPLSPECASEAAALSSSLPLSTVVGSAVTTPSTSIVGSAPAEYDWPSGLAGGDMASSFPSSPSSLGFMTGSLGSFGNLPGDDDDMFGFDP
uniref:WRKY domain-containing protein n=1 Tax=Oryza punctata TaxID=4537 RepID=A0A0E0LPU4_ORYPU